MMIYQMEPCCLVIAKIGNSFLWHSRVALAWQCISLKTRLDRNVVHKVLTAATLDADLGGFSSDGRGRYHNTLDFHEAGDLFRLQRDKYSKPNATLGDTSS